jgi:hypothetical protein
MDVADLPYPWERQPGETAKAYAAFCGYRDLPPQERSLQRLRSEMADEGYVVTKNWLGEWSAKWDWVERTMDWDQEVDRRQREKFVAERESMAQRHAQQAVMLQEALMLPAKALADKLRRDHVGTVAALSNLSVGELLSLIVQATRVFGPLMNAERLSRDGVTAPPPPPRPTSDQVEAGSDEERMLQIVEAFEEAGIQWPTTDDEAEEVATTLAAALADSDDD